MSLVDEVNRAMLFPRDGFPQGWDYAPRGNRSAAEAGFAAGGPFFDADALNAARAPERNAAIAARAGRGPTTRGPILGKRKRKRKLIPVKRALDYGSFNAYAASDRFLVDMAEAFREANQVFPTGGRSRADTRSAVRSTRLGRSSLLGRRQGGFVAPKGVKAPPAAPRKPAKPPAPPWQPPKPPKKPPAPPRAAQAALPGTPGKVRKVPIRPWEGAARVPKSGSSSSDLLKAVGVQTRVAVGRGLQVIMPPVGKLETVRKAVGALTKAARALGKLDITKPRAPFKLKPARPFFPAPPAPPPSPFPPLQRVLDLLRPGRPRLDLPEGVKAPGDSLLDPARPGVGPRNLTQPQEQGLTSRSKACECPETKPKKKRLSCRQGYFRETSRGITYKTWSTRKCPV